MYFSLLSGRFRRGRGFVGGAGAVTQPSQWVAGNKTLLLDANTPAATIVSGSMAVFAIPRGEEPGERIYLFSLAAGNSLWPVSLPEGAAGWGLLCVPLEATCLNAPDRKPLFALEDWLGKLGEALFDCPTFAS